MGETRHRGVLASIECIDKLKKAKAKERNSDGKVWTYTDVSTESGVDSKTVSRFFNRKTRVDETTAMAICQSLKVEFEQDANIPEGEIDPPSIPTPTTETLPQQRKLFGEANYPLPNWVGRDKLLTDLHTKLQSNRRVLVLCGQGGIGKTSLAVKLMAACGVDTSTSQLLATCPYDNVLFYQVGESDSFELLVAKFFDAFGLAPNRDGTPAQKIETIVQRLHQQRWLVVLDNLESLMEFDSAKSKSADVGDLLNALAYGGHNSQIVITSRKFPEDLFDRRGRGFNPGVVCEQKIPGISVADSIELLKKLGARDSQADLEWIAGRVDGNVLILELLASYAKNKPGLLRKQPHLVTNEAKPIVRAQWKLQGVPAQDLVQRMCVLRMGMKSKELTILRLLQPDGEEMEPTPEADAVTADLLTGLVNSDLLQDRYDESDCESRYVLHPLMAETLQAIFADDLELLWQYAAWLYGSLDRQYPSLEDFLFIIEELYFCLLLGDEDKAKDLTKRYKKYTDLHDREKIAYYYYDLLNIDRWRGDIARNRGDIARNRGDYDQAEALYNQSLAAYTELGDRAGMAAIWGLLGDIARNRGDYNEAEALYNQSLAVYTELDDRAGMATTWASLGYIASNRGDYDKAEALYNQSLAVRTKLGDRAGMASSWGLLGYIASNRGDYDKAEALYNQSLAVYTELDDRAGMAAIWGLLGYIASNRGDYDRAEDLYNQSLAVRTKLGDRAGMASSWGLLGYIASNRGDYDRAEDLYNQSLAVRTKLGDGAGMAAIWGCLGENELGRGNLATAEIWLKQALTVFEELQIPDMLAEVNWCLARLYRAKGDESQGQTHYSISHNLYTKLGAKKELEKIESAWNVSG